MTEPGPLSPHTSDVGVPAGGQSVAALLHALGNHLALTTGYCELIEHSEGIPEDLLDLIVEAREGAKAAVQTLRVIERTLGLAV